jgi:hypothetical protein
MLTDVRETAEHAAVVDHLRRLHEPGFGRPHALPNRMRRPTAAGWS